jgi:ketosteroid isomerase-like protein
MTFARKKTACGLALAALVAGLALGAGDFTDTSERWEKAYNAGDAAGVAALYTEDGVVLPPHAEAATGRKAIQAFVEKDIAASKGSVLEIESVEYSKAGDLGFARGSWRMKDASGTVLDEGNWIEVRKKVGGKWLIHNDIWNSSRPPSP